MNSILALSLLLALGFAGAVAARMVRLPSVTGYIVAGMVLGPIGFDLLPHDLLEGRLQTFTDIALMLVAFGIGESLDLQQFRRGGRAVVRIGLAESALCFVVVAVAVTIVAKLSASFDVLSTWQTCIAAGLVAGAIAVATAPASTIAVVRELGAAGVVSRTVLSAVAMNNAASITLFGVAAAVARILLGTAPQEAWLQFAVPMAVTAGSLALGLLVGLMTDLAVHHLSRRSDVLIVSLGAVFFCGGAAELLGFSAMLAGLAAGFAVVNRDRRDVRAFRAINDFEPPIYGIFFALAGAQLHLAELVTGGIVGLVFVLARAAGKVAGAWLGAAGSGLDPRVRGRFGLGLLSQAGLAIGLAYLVQQDPSLVAVRSMLINVVVASVVVNELVGPPLLRLILVQAGEGPAEVEAGAPVPSREQAVDVHVVPWSWPKLKPPERARGTVVFGLQHPGTVRGLARIAILMANYYQARPIGVHVAVEEEPEDFWGGSLDENTRALFAQARAEGEEMGYPVMTTVEFASSPAIGLVSVASAEEAQAIVLGHPLRGTAHEFRRVVDEVAREALCPVVVVRLTGQLHTERILVPISNVEDLSPIRPVVCALAAVEHHEVTLLALLPPEASPADEEAMMKEMDELISCSAMPGEVRLGTLRAEARLLAVLDAAREHDILVMTSGTSRGLRRLFFGSLAEDVAVRCTRPIIMVRPGMEAVSFAERHEARRV